jgi:hypothetical protein
MKIPRISRWVIKDGIIYVENDICILAWAPTDDLTQIGKIGWHGPEKICVEFVSRADFDAVAARCTHALYAEAGEKASDDNERT